VYDKDNEPEAFDRMTPLAQATLRTWVRLALVKTPTVRSGRRNHSYGLKHAAEESIGGYISNGELKGGMSAEGYAHKAIDNGLNWLFNSAERRPLVGEVVAFEWLCARLREEQAERIAARRAG
jgi:hypothetical protein